MPDPVDGTPLTNAKSEVLFYSQFNKETDDCAGESAVESAVESIKGYLGSSLNYANKGNDIDKIVKGVCYVDKIYKGTSTHPHQSELCSFLYYYIGDVLSKNPKCDNMFSLIMNMICSALESSYKLKGCKIECSTKHDKDIFLKRKAIFDYYHDFSVIQGELLQENHQCAAKYGSYLSAVVPIYEEVRQNCERASSSTDPYCIQFNIWFNGGKNNTNINPEQLKSKCESSQEGLEPRPGSGPGTTSSIGSGSGVVPTIVSTVLPMMGLPTVAFFLYKVKLPL
ncbi:KIR protein [Plasmodium coatneyi]|uniref:KIR protein n=1 Tax=Plasmodium coatneyi TaxID=208452 RepID=A0A1B1E6F9_9APIC|nr:KIR protein [Plasmodium coatneyi]ANQ10606.1 KIR protein [Plasmodium coatneyi]